MADTPQHREAAHPTSFTYLKVGLTLAALTGIEVGVFYIDALEPAFLAIFLILSVVKFVLVVLFYMHLKFDARLFSTVFVGGLLLAVAVVVVLMALFQVLSAVANPQEGGEVVVAVPTPTPTPAPAATPTSTPTLGPTPTPGGPTVTPTSTPEPEKPDAGPSGALAAQGQEIFMTAPANAGPQALWCSLCHTVGDVAAGLIGPDLTHIATDAANRKPGMSARDYIRESIRDPEVFVPTGVDRATAGLMTNSITQGLTDDQVDALVAFLLERE